MKYSYQVLGFRARTHGFYYVDQSAPPTHATCQCADCGDECKIVGAVEILPDPLSFVTQTVVVCQHAADQLLLAPNTKPALNQESTSMFPQTAKTEEKERTATSEIVVGFELEVNTLRLLNPEELRALVLQRRDRQTRAGRDSLSTESLIECEDHKRVFESSEDAFTYLARLDHRDVLDITAIGYNARGVPVSIGRLAPRAVMHPEYQFLAIHSGRMAPSDEPWLWPKS